MTKACNNMHTTAKGAVSNYSRLKWHVGCSTQNKNRKLKRLIMRRNCFINAPTPLHPAPFSLRCRNPTFSSASLTVPFPPCALSLEGKSKGFSFISDWRRGAQTRLPRETREETANTLPQISDLGGAENSMRVFVCGDEDFPHSPDVALSLNALPPRYRRAKIHCDCYWGKTTHVWRTKDNCIDLFGKWSSSKCIS